MERKMLNREFWKYVLPSMFAMLLSGFYSIVDGLFVGNSVGDTALAAINLAYPIQVILNATAIGIGIGGAVAMTYFKGQEKEEQADHAIGSTFLLLLILGIVLSIVLFFMAPNLLTMLGAQGAVYKDAYDYIFVILLGGLLPVLGNGLNPLIRNCGKTLTATLCMSSGLITNIVLDYVLVFRWNMGLTGAALATIIAQGVVALSGLVFLWYSTMRFLSWKHFLPTKDLIRRIIRVGVSPFGQTLVPCIITILTNWMCIKYGGDPALTIFSVVCYVLASAQLLLQGIGDGIQPLLSYNHGKNRQDNIHYLHRKAMIMSLVVSFVLSGLAIYFANDLTALFGLSSSLFAPARLALIITAISFPFIGIVRLTSAVFYATGKTKNSTFLIYLEPCVLVPLCLLVCSHLFGLIGVWFAYPAAQMILCGLALLFQDSSVIFSERSLMYNPSSEAIL